MRRSASVPLTAADVTAELVHQLRDRAKYRFRGSTPPRNGQKIPILNTVPDAAVSEDGTAQLRLYDPIDSWGGDWGVSASEFSDVLGRLPADVSTIELRVNSPGGEVFDAIAIMNLLRSHDADVRVVVDGIAASAASFIASSADETIMGKNSEMMIHDALGLALGNAADLHKMGDVLDHISNNIASVYADKSGGEQQFWRDAMLTETWYNADEAVAAGLADSVGTSVTAPADQTVDGTSADDAPPADDVEDRFDLAALFEHAGRKDAPAPPIPSAAQASDTQETSDDVSGSELARRHRHNARRFAASG